MMFSYEVNKLFCTLILFVCYIVAVLQNSWFQRMFNFLNVKAFDFFFFHCLVGET